MEVALALKEKGINKSALVNDFLKNYLEIKDEPSTINLIKKIKKKRLELLKLEEVELKQKKENDRAIKIKG